MVSLVLLALIMAVILSLSLLSLLSLSSLPSYSSFFLSSSSYAISLPYSAFGSTPGLDERTTVTGDQDNNTTSTANSQQVPNNSNNTNPLRTYTNAALDLSVQYPPAWGVMELKNNRQANASEVVPVIISPLEDQSDKFQERMRIGVQNLVPTMTLEDFTKSNLDSYKDLSDTIKILESEPTTLGGQPAHKIVYTDDSQKDVKLKYIQVWTVVNNSKAYVVTFASEESKYKDYLSDAQNILSSFKITGGNSVNTSSQGQKNYLTFDDPLFGIKLDYPSSWTKTQPGLPLDNRSFAQLVSFNAPRPAPSIPDNENNKSSSNSSLVTINVGINDLARYISEKGTTSSDNDNNTSNSGIRNLSLAEYSSGQIENIKLLGAKLTSSIKTTVGGLPGQEVHYFVDKDLLITQAWTLNDGKAYHIVLTANNPDDFMGNLPVFREMVKSIKFYSNSSKK